MKYKFIFREEAEVGGYSKKCFDGVFVPMICRIIYSKYVYMYNLSPSLLIITNIVFYITVQDTINAHSIKISLLHLQSSNSYHKSYLHFYHFHLQTSYY